MWSKRRIILCNLPQTVTGSLKVADLSTPLFRKQPSFVAETRAPDKNTDAVLPWLAKRYCCRFPPEVVHTTLSHRRFPGVPVQQADKLTQLRRLACSVSQRDNKQPHLTSQRLFFRMAKHRRQGDQSDRRPENNTVTITSNGCTHGT